jgi:hypothetical protein
MFYQIKTSSHFISAVRKLSTIKSNIENVDFEKYLEMIKEV